MAAIFRTKKARIEEQLDLNDGDYTDASPKGSVDENIRELVSDIKNLDGFVTTSSCGGRIAVYCEGPPKTSAGGKGGGRWLFTSHQPVNADAYRQEGALLELLGLPSGMDVSVPAASADVSFVHLKYEAMVGLPHVMPHLVLLSVSSKIQDPRLRPTSSVFHDSFKIVSLTFTRSYTF